MFTGPDPSLQAHETASLMLRPGNDSKSYVDSLSRAPAGGISTGTGRMAASLSKSSSLFSGLGRLRSGIISSTRDYRRTFVSASAARGGQYQRGGPGPLRAKAKDDMEGE